MYDFCLNHEIIDVAVKKKSGFFTLDYVIHNKKAIAISASHLIDFFN